MPAKNNPLVSVVIPCYNGEDYIAEAIYSVCDQSYDNIEILFVDDKSTDNSIRAAVDAINTAATKRRGRILPLNRNIGPCAVLDIGFRMVYGRYACMLAADDAFANMDYVSEVVDTMEATGAAWCYNTIMLKGPHIQLAKPVQTKWLVSHIFDDVVMGFPWLCEKLLKHRNPVNSSSLMFDMEAYHTNNLSWSGGKARSVCDGIILRQMFQKGMPGVALHSLGAFYREHDKQFSKTKVYNDEHELFRKEKT